MLSKEDKCSHFDHQFYLHTYTDLVKAGITSEEAAYSHYTHHGLTEGRTGSLYEMQYSMRVNHAKVKDQCDAFHPNLRTAPENKMNILVRTSNRPNHFAQCIQSVFEQSYQNFHVYVCYDKIESLDYLEQYDRNSQITCFPVYVKSDEKYKYNLYCNKLMDKVQDGYILFLDDDDKLVHNHVLSMLNEELGQNNDTLVVGQFMRADKLIYPADINKDLVLGEITISSVCFHHSLKRNIKWDDKQCGDFRFFSQIINPLLCVKRNSAAGSYCASHIGVLCSEQSAFVPYIKQCDIIIASTQFDDKIGHYGENE